MQTNLPALFSDPGWLTVHWNYILHCPPLPLPISVHTLMYKLCVSFPEWNCHGWEESPLKWTLAEESIFPKITRVMVPQWLRASGTIPQDGHWWLLPEHKRRFREHKQRKGGHKAAFADFFPFGVSPLFFIFLSFPNLTSAHSTYWSGCVLISRSKQTLTHPSWLRHKLQVSLQLTQLCLAKGQKNSSKGKPLVRGSCAFWSLGCGSLSLSPASSYSPNCRSPQSASRRRVSGWRRNSFNSHCRTSSTTGVLFVSWLVWIAFIQRRSSPVVERTSNKSQLYYFLNM